MTGSEEGRGRGAERPQEMPGSGWRDILWRTKDEVTKDHVSMIAASIAFYSLLAIFPLVAAIISIWGLMFDPQQIAGQIEAVSSALPEDAAGIVTDQAQAVASSSGAGISFGVIFGILLALYGASKGMQAMIEGLNIVYDEDEERGFIRLYLLIFAFTIGLILSVIVVLGLVAVLPAVLAFFGLGSTVEALISYARWPLLLVMALFGLAILYRFAPCREEPKWRWVSPGALVATVLWLVGSIGFSIYVSNFGSYNETYGSIGAVVVLLMWFWLSAFIVLLGAELNCELEHQTARDTTDGDPEPMGRRGAYAADTVGQKP